MSLPRLHDGDATPTTAWVGCQIAEESVDDHPSTVTDPDRQLAVVPRAVGVWRTRSNAAMSAGSTGHDLR
jgi:hypothetical protein